MNMKAMNVIRPSYYHLLGLPISPQSNLQCSTCNRDVPVGREVHDRCHHSVLAPWHLAVLFEGLSGEPECMEFTLDDFILMESPKLAKLYSEDGGKALQGMVAWEQSLDAISPLA